MLHTVSNGVDSLLHVELCAYQPPFLPLYVVQLLLDLDLEVQLLSKPGHFSVDVWVFQPSQYLVNGICLRVFPCELLDLCVGEWYGELDGVRCVEIDGGGVGGCSSLHASYYLLIVIAVIDVRC